MPPLDGFLQYGALGILLAVTLFIVRRMFDQSDEALGFVREQIEKANVERSGQMTAWIDMTKDMIVASVTTAEALGRINESLGHISDQQREITTCLRELNGQKE